jgi:hypothetical protein
MWAQFPAERQEFLVNEKTGSYETSGQFGGIGSLYISLENKKIIFQGLHPAQFGRVFPVSLFRGEKWSSAIRDWHRLLSFHRVMEVT